MNREQESWRALAARQGGLITRDQLRAAGVSPRRVAQRIAHERWVLRAPTVVGTTTGPPSRDQLMWLAVLHGGRRALLGGLTAAAEAGLNHWYRDEVTALVPYGDEVPPRIDGIRYVRSRRPLMTLRATTAGPPRLRLEPAILLFAAGERSERTARGVLAAAVQQQLTSPELLASWLVRLRPLRRSPLLRVALADMAGGAQSVAEIDLKRLCRRYGLTLPARQTKRRDAEGRLRYTDCEWRLLDGRILILEIDGLFHMEVAQWEDDLARQRALSSAGTILVRCTAREVRDEPDRLARDLMRLGVPKAA